MNSLKLNADTCMSALISASTTTDQLKNAESGLEQMCEVPLFSLVLLQYLEPQAPPSPPLPRPVRRLAAILFRRCIVKKHWKAGTVTDTTTGEKRPSLVISNEEKEEVRRRLPLLLADPDGSVRSLTAAALGSIGSIEWPAIWPGFVDGLQSLIDGPKKRQQSVSNSSSNELVADWLKADGALRCLDEVLGSCSATDMPAVAAALTPSLFSICSLSSSQSQLTPPGSSVFVNGMKERAFDCFIRIIEQLSLSCDMDKKTKKAVTAFVGSSIAGPLLAAIGANLATPGWYAEACQLKHSALCCLNTLMMNFSSLPPLKASAAIVCAQVTEFAKLAAKKYVSVVVDDGDEEDPPSYDTSSSTSSSTSTSNLDSYAVVNTNEGGGGSEGSTPLESILVSYVQFVSMMNMSTVKAANKAMLSNLPQAISVLLCCCQLAESQLQSWDSSPEAYVQDEGDDSFESTLRMEVQDALRAAFDVNNKLARVTIEATTALCASSISAALGNTAAMNDPRILAAHSLSSPLFSSERWKVVEAAIYALGCISGEWIEFNESQQRPEEASIITPGQFATQLSAILQSGGRGLMADDKIQECAPYLLGRSLWCAARLASALPEAACGSLINWSVEGLTPSHPLPIRFAACVSLARLLKRAPTEVVETHGVLIFERIALMIMPYVYESTSTTGATSTAGGDNISNSDNISYLVDLVAKAIEYAPRASGQCEPSISPLLLALWLKHGNNPVMCPQIARALTHLVWHENPSVSSSVAQRLLPVVSNVLSKALHLQQQSESSTTSSGADEETFPSGLIEHNIGILRALVERAADSHTEAMKALSSSPQYTPLPPAISPLLRLNAMLLSTTSDASIVSASARLLACSIRIFGPHILESSVNPSLLGACFGKLVQADAHSDSAISHVGVVAIAVLRHLLSSLPADAIDHMLAGLCTRIVHTRLPSTQERLLAAVAYAIVSDGNDSNNPQPVVLQKLASLPVTLPQPQGSKKRSTSTSTDPWSCAAPVTSSSRQVPALVVWAKVACDYYDLITRPQVRRLLSAAISRILGHPNSFKLLMLVRVNGEQISESDQQQQQSSSSGSSSISSRTRSGRAKAGKRILNTEVVLPVRLLTKFIKAFFDDVRDASGVEEAEDDDGGDDGNDDEGYDHDDEEGEEEEEDEDEEDGEESGRRPRGERSPFVDASTLRGLLDYDDEDNDDEEEDDGRGKGGGVRLSDLLDGKGQNKQLAALLASGHDDYDDDDDNGGFNDAMDDDERREEEDPLGLGLDADLSSSGGGANKDALIALLREPTAAASAGKAFLGSLAAAAAQGETTAKVLIEATLLQLNDSEKEELNNRMK